MAQIGSTDSIADNISTFLQEMREIAHILDTLTPTSLVIIDELGRG